MNRTFLGLALVVALQSAWVLGTSARHEFLRETGTVIRINARTVDPRDLLRGDYVVLGYDMHSMALSQFEPLNAPMPWRPGAPVFVELEPVGPVYQPIRASLLKPATPAPGNVVIAGQLAQAVGPEADSSHQVRITYGLERFHVREGTGNPQGQLVAEIAIGRNGKAALREVFINNVPYAEAMRTQGR